MACRMSCSYPLYCLYHSHSIAHSTIIFITIVLLTPKPIPQQFYRHSTAIQATAILHVILLQPILLLLYCHCTTFFCYSTAIILYNHSVVILKPILPLILRPIILHSTVILLPLDNNSTAIL